ncbi:MAG: tetratricopeptide repeat protein [Polyangiaceae bacterium]|nr:tetratricopeptide repeat protein [Polyangiaceae bacterium]
MNERVKQLLVLGREHYEKREFDRAEQMLRLVLEEEDRCADVHDMLGIIAHSHGDFRVAESHFERALEINPAYTEAALNLAVTYNDRGKYDKAREIYTRIKKGPADAAFGLDPFVRGKIANMHADLGKAYHDAGLIHEAIAEYERATLLCPEFADLHVRLGVLLREVNDLSNARVHYEAALKAKPAYVPARVQLGVTLLALGDAVAAEEQWKQVIKVEPDNSQAKMYLRMLDRNRSDKPPTV